VPSSRFVEERFDMTDTLDKREIRAVLGLDGPVSTSKWNRKVVPVAAVFFGLVALVMFVSSLGGGSTWQYFTAPVSKGGLVVTVTATGTLEANNQVDVGSELSGIISAVEVDYNDIVSEGQVLAKLDAARLESRVLFSLAALEAAEAKVQEANATVRQTERELERARDLAGRGFESAEGLDAAQAAYDRARASLALSEAQVTEAQAQLRSDETDLEKTVIVSPIDGIVLVRNVEPGQTVAASFQTPLLFQLAEDLSRMELHVDVDEADVSQIQVGQEAGFTVDAYPNVMFPATISQVRYAPRMTEGVVTYETLLSLDNSDLLLRPGMTATAEITVETVENTRLVPNEALRFIPPTEIASDQNGGLMVSILPQPPQRTSSVTNGQSFEGTEKTVWILSQGEPTAVPVEVGATDGRMTEILVGDLEVGSEVLVDAIEP